LTTNSNVSPPHVPLLPDDKRPQANPERPLVDVARIAAQADPERIQRLLSIVVRPPQLRLRNVEAKCRAAGAYGRFALQYGAVGRLQHGPDSQFGVRRQPLHVGADIEPDGTALVMLRYVHIVDPAQVVAEDRDIPPNARLR